MKTDTTGYNYWWERSDLSYMGSKLHFAGVSCETLIQQYGTPLFAYSRNRVLDNINRLSNALASIQLPSQLLFAMKSNRHPEILKLIAQETHCGIDACSPREVELAVRYGFTPDRISVTSTAVSDTDWLTYSTYPDILFNCDSISALKRIGKQGYRTKVGIRINPQIGVGYSGNLLVQYAGQKPTKFGIYPDYMDEARKVATDLGIEIVGLHMHAGSGFTQSGLESYQKALDKIADIATSFDRLEYINIGGGLGVPLKENDQALNLADWAQTVYNALGKLGMKVFVEPGDHISKDAGILLAEVIEVELKGGTQFAFVNAGFNLHPEPAFYKLPCEPVPVNQPVNPAENRTTIVGNINEALDIFNENHPIHLVEGDYLAFLNAGAYGASMSSNHCLRSELKEIII